MDLAKQIRLSRIFSHPSKRLCSVAVDHFVGYRQRLPEGLTNLSDAIRQLVEGKPDAITMFKGVAKGTWSPYAGSVSLIIQAVSFTVDDSIIQTLAEPEEVLRLGADAIAVSIGVRGPNEGKFLGILAENVARADRIGLPVIAHIYPRDFSNGAKIVFDHENIMWAVRCGVECGADVIKVPFTGTVESFREIVATSPVPVVAAGGPRSETLDAALEMMVKVVESGARGGTIGRNVWGASDPTLALQAFRAVIHGGMSAAEALAHAGLSRPRGQASGGVPLPAGRVAGRDGKQEGGANGLVAA
ncbi:MAG: aldolase [Verrucomicrobia bacterium]|nr:MAG: aldolase [Verrucomicrobiota bacterium]